jgi:formylglycine-generating enzyme
MRQVSSRKIALWIAALSVCQGVWAEQPQSPKKNAGGSRWALLIGVDEYLHCESLKYAGADMRAMRGRLVATGFPEKQVFLLHDKAEQSKYRPFKPNIDRELEQVLGMVEQDDLVVLAFSGHGVHLDSRSYLCPTEAELKDAKTLVSLDTVYERLAKCPASLKLLLVDACRNDPRREGQRGVGPNVGTKQFAESLERPPQGILLLTSCAPGQVSMEEKDFGHGVFMHFLLEGLGGKAADQDGAVSLVGLFKYANKHTKFYVHDKFNGFQTPALRGDIQDDFELARVDKRSTLPPPLAVAPFDAVEARRHQEYWSEHLGKPREVANSIGMKLVLIPPGEFMMGNGRTPEEEVELFKRYGMEKKLTADFFKNEYPYHRVRITRAFYMGAHNVTRGQFRRFVAETGYKTDAETDGKGGYGVSGANAAKQSVDFSWRYPGFAQTDDHPVLNVSWNDAAAFCKWLARKEGKNYRLPTEAEWEYACRAGTTTRYHCGDDPEGVASVGNVADALANARFPHWTEPIRAADGYVFTSPVGSFRPNAFSLYDMHGNACQWCRDRYSETYYAASSTNDPHGPDSGSTRVFRGSAWVARPDSARSCHREGYTPDSKDVNSGFRVVRTP